MHHLLELPTELLLNVLQELSFEDLLHCKRVCYIQLLESVTVDADM